MEAKSEKKAEKDDVSEQEIEIIMPPQPLMAEKDDKPSEDGGANQAMQKSSKMM